MSSTYGFSISSQTDVSPQVEVFEVVDFSVSVDYISSVGPPLM